jgi:YidC/Oxa1 family membrane protein insertase
MDQQKRLLLAIALSFGLTMVWTNFVWKPRADEQARLAREAAAKLDAGVVAEALDAGAAELPTVAAAAPVVLEDGGVAEAPPAPVQLEAKTFSLERPTTALTFTTEGGGLSSAVLRGDREREEKHLTILEGWKKLFGATFEPAAHMNLAVPAPAVGPQLAISILGDKPLSGFQRYAVTEETPGKVVFTTTSGPWEVTKTFTWNPTAERSDKDPSGYLSTLEVSVKNAGQAPVTAELAVHAARAITPGSEEAPSMFGGIGNESSVLCSVAGDVKRKTPSSGGGGFFGGSSNETSHEEKGALHYVGIDQQYFLTAVWPKTGALEGRCLLNASPTFRQASLVSPLALQPGETVTRSYGVFMGPKDLELLLALGKAPAGPPEGGTVAAFDPKLDSTVDFGLWAFICKLLLVFMRSFHSATGNWGVAIILLTVTVKVLLLPLTHRAMVSAEAMKELQPKMEEIRKKFPDDREKQNVEMMRLYQEGKVNPLGGCLPLLLQLPIWAALFTTLRTSYELYGEPFFGVWSNLTSKDPTYILPLALGVTMIITQRLQPQMMDKSQAFLMTWVMPIFFTAIMMNYPAGLALYIFTNNLLSIIQQFALRKYLEKQKLAKAAAAGGAK